MIREHSLGQGPFLPDLLKPSDVAGYEPSPPDWARETLPWGGTWGADLGTAPALGKPVRPQRRL